MSAPDCKQPKTKNEEYPKGSGIRIRRIQNSNERGIFGEAYQVTIPAKLTGAKRKRLNFPTLKEAREAAADHDAGHKKLGSAFHGLTEHERREAVQAVEEARKAGVALLEAVRFAIPRMRPTGGDKTVSEIVDLLVASKERRKLRPKSIHDCKVRTRRIKEAFGTLNAKSVTAKQIVEWIHGMKLSPKSNQNYLGVVREVFDCAIEHKHAAVNPVADISKSQWREMIGKGDAGEIGVLTCEQAEQFLRCALDSNDKLGLLAPVVLGLFCGIRTEELKGLGWQDIKLHPGAESFVTIPAGIAKKRRIRNVEIPGNAVAWLLRCKHRAGRVSPHSESTDLFQKRFTELQEVAGFRAKNEDGEWVSKWPRNAMRHSFGTYHFAAHGDSLRTARLLGHKADDDVLFTHYRALAKREDGEKYFSILPPKSDEVVLPFPKTA